MEGHIGVDESGKGDYFGPLVVAGCYVGPEHLAELDGVMDSKKLTDAKATMLAAAIRAVCPHSILTIMPTRYNELYAEIQNLNRLLEWGHVKVITEVHKLYPCAHALSDQFADPRRLKAKLAAKNLDITLETRVRAEEDIAVAAASILARAEFLRRLKELSRQFEIELPKGATVVKDKGVQFVRKYGAERLGEVAKLHFKTTAQVRAMAAR